ncbi:PAS domain S-box protein [Methanoculleus sp. Wushi-C6]|uniref:histidine kinase n=1 Tax=Methanoculleus caldifontis TaxID=2651577 RepID=A0ABU3X1A1_9EURY|nr:PAS domain S-box protein [Methanoculleus sp. Wushi-C6]MDV2481838.1 PAS domain S-box protein [Methanoculleus sp. Wushi-C6]
MHTLASPDHILYVDDEEALLDIGRIFLERAGGIVVDITASPLEALRMILSGRYDAIVSDYQMPEMDGIALLKEVRKAGSRVPFIIFTGRGREEVAIEALNNGADFYIQKGGNPKTQFAELANAVRQLAGRRRAEAAFRESEEMLHKAESLAHLGSWEFDHRAGRLVWSDEVYHIFGLDPAGQPPSYETFLSMVHPDDRTLFDTTYFASIADGESTYEIEHRLLRSDTGESRYVIERCEHIRDDSGDIVRSVGMVHDITVRKLAELELLSRHEELQAAYEQLAAIEEELRTSFDDLAESQHRLQESERRFADIIEFLPDAAFVIDTDGHVVAWNRAVEELTGVPKAEVLGRGDHAYAVPFYGEARPGLIDYVLHPDRMADCPYRIIARDGELLESETSLARPGGKDTVLRLRASPLYDRKGRCVGAVETIRDITGQKRVEADLRTTKDYLENLIDRANAPIIVWSPECVITRFNRAFESLTGIPADEAVGARLEILFPEESRSESMEQIRRAMAGEQWDDVEIPIQNRSGSARTVLWSSANVTQNGTDRPIATIAQGTDITARKQAQVELLQRHEELQAAYEQLASIEEELRTSFDDLAGSQRHLKESEGRYRRLAENAEDIIYRIEFLPEVRFAYVNPAITRMLGYMPEEYYADASLAERTIHPDDRNRIASLGVGSIADRPLTLRWVRKDGGTVWVEQRNIPVLDSAGRVIGLEGIGRDVTEAKQAEERLVESEGSVRKKLESILSPRGDIGSLDLAEIIDVPAVQSLMDDFYGLTKIPVAIADTRGRVLIDAGWQEICTKYHRAHPETCRHCTESDTVLSAGIPAGESRMYRCRNNMWDVATPIVVGERHLGNVYTGQFFFEGEEPDYEIFRSQARRYGFDEEGYLTALRAVPRLSKAHIDAALAFLREFAGLISRLSYSNITLARSLAERDALTRTLEETAGRLARTQEIAHIGSWEFDHRTRRLTWSDETFQIFGVNPAGGAPGYEMFLSLVHPDDRALVDTTYSTSIADGGETYEIEHRILRNDTGEVRHVVERCEHLRDGSGAIVRSVGMVHDVTDRKLAELERLHRHEELQVAYAQLASVEEELRTGFDDLARSQHRLLESKERYRRISESISDVVYSCVLPDMGGYALDWIAGAVHEITGYTEEQLLAMRCWRAIVHPDDLPIFERETLGLFPGKSSLFEIRIVRRDGSVRWLRASANCIGGEDGHVRLYGGWQDITEQKETEEALRETAERMESIFRAAPTGIGMVVDGVLREVNGRLCDIVGYTRDELIGRPARLLYPDDAKYESALQQMRTQIRETGTCTLEARARRKDGTIIDVLLSGTPLDSGAFFRGVTFTVLDITERKAMEREIEYHAGELARQTNSLAVANRKLSLMSSITRHDILNQLTILLGNLSFAEEAVQDLKISEYLARVQSAADRIRRQIEFTRDYTELGVRSPEWQRVGDAIGSAALHGLPVEEEAGDLVVYADPMLATVFSNLMDNTIRHGESATRVRVRYRPEEDGSLALIWEDDGVGVPAGEKKQIFNRGVGKNTGFGLFLIREILGITGIGIRETGEPGKGARFEMRVPRGAYRL